MSSRNPIPPEQSARRRIDPSLAFVLCAVALYIAYFATHTLNVHRGLGTFSYDYALYDQGLWLTSRFKEPFVTLMGRNLFGDHTSFILVFLVPLFWVAPGATVLLTAHTAVIAAGAIPLYLIGRARLSPWVGALMAVVYLIHPAVSWTNSENFHPDAALGFTFSLALYGALQRRWRAYTIGVVLSLLVKEDVVLVVLPLGVWVALMRNRKVGVATVLGSVGYALVAMLVIMRALIGVPTLNTWRIPFGGPMGFLGAVFTQPVDVIAHFVSDGRPFYLFQMVLPVAFVFLRRPGVALISMLVMFTNVLSTYWYQYQIQYHYSLAAVPALIAGAIYGIEALKGTPRVYDAALTAVTSCAMVAAVLWAPLPGMRSVPATWPPDHPVAVAARDVVARVPKDASVAAHYAITAQIPHRVEIYQFPTPFRIMLYGTDISREGTRDLERAERVEYLVLQTAKSAETQADFDAIAGAFTKVHNNEYWELWRRVPGAPLLPVATEIIVSG